MSFGLPQASIPLELCSSLGSHPNFPEYHRAKEGVRTDLIQMMAEDAICACAVRNGLRPNPGFGNHSLKYLICHCTEDERQERLHCHVTNN